MTRPIGYYVHHQGVGHLHRARLIKASLERPCTLMGTFAGDECDVLDLPDDRIGIQVFSGRDGAANRPLAFHYAPLAVEGLRDRMWRIAEWIATHDPALFIIDVSVEVALFVRLMSVPIVVVRLAGLRSDAPHLEAFRAAEALLAPYPEVFESDATPSWVREKTIYAGFIAPSLSGKATAAEEPGVVAVIIGRGGLGYDPALLAAAAAVTPDYDWHVYGAVPEHSIERYNLRFHGWIDELALPIDRAEIVVGGAGDGVLALVAARNKRFICLPEPRAFDEQRDKAMTLAREGFALALDAWPNAAEWPAVLQKAQALDTRRLHALYDRSALERTALAIEQIVDGFGTPSDR